MKTVIDMAQEAVFYKDLFAYEDFKNSLERFAELVRADAIADAIADAVEREREACAKLAEEHMQECEGVSFGVGAAIRARGNT